MTLPSSSVEAQQEDDQATFEALGDDYDDDLNAEGMEIEPTDEEIRLALK